MKTLSREHARPLRGKNASCCCCFFFFCFFLAQWTFMAEMLDKDWFIFGSSFDFGCRFSFRRKQSFPILSIGKLYFSDKLDTAVRDDEPAGESDGDTLPISSTCSICQMKKKYFRSDKWSCLSESCNSSWAKSDPVQDIVDRLMWMVNFIQWFDKKSLSNWRVDANDD